jgi:hypothetical protein
MPVNCGRPFAVGSAQGTASEAAVVRRVCAVNIFCFVRDLRAPTRSAFVAISETAGARNSKRGHRMMPDMDAAIAQAVAEQPERRRAPRFRCAGAGALSVSLIGAPEREMLVRNISTGGIEALIGQPAEPDQLLTIELFNRAKNCWHLKTVRIVYAFSHDETRWRVGCGFSFPLTESELQQLLGGGTR